MDLIHVTGNTYYLDGPQLIGLRSEERRVGKECAA